VLTPHSTDAAIEDAAYCDRQTERRVLSVTVRLSLLVTTRDREPCENGRTDQGADRWGRLTWIEGTEC